MSSDESHSLAVRTALQVFLINAFQSLEVAVVRTECLQLVTLLSWESLLPQRRDATFVTHTHLGKAYRALQKNATKFPAEKLKRSEFDRAYLSKAIALFLKTLGSVSADGDAPDTPLVRYLERFVELFIDLENQLTTRRFLNALLEDHQVVVACRQSGLFARQEGSLFRELVSTLAFYVGFEISDLTGEALSSVEVDKRVRIFVLCQGYRY